MENAKKMLDMQFRFHIASPLRPGWAAPGIRADSTENDKEKSK
jgi:hypothetical protein